MAQSEEPDSPLCPLPLKLKSPADKVYDIYRRKCYLFPKIMPLKIRKVVLIKDEWDSLGSERRWTFIDENCGIWEDIVQPIVDQTKSITWSLKHGEVPHILYKALSVDYQFSPDGEGCLAEVRLNFHRQNANSPKPADYVDFICEMIKAVDDYLQSNENDA